MSEEPLVSIGLPTYNRAATLRRAVDSALAQTYGNLELLICDNASTDGTEALCRSAAATDPRVRYVRHPQNLGPTANFNALFDGCRGTFVMMLADDDWLEPGYVSACLDRLRADPRLALVAGRARYVRGDRFVHDGVRHEHIGATASERLLDYLRQVDDNGVFYGLMSGEVLRAVRPLPNVLGNDWLHVARIVSLGHVCTLGQVRINRELDGTSVDVGSILETFRSAAWQARVPQLVIAWHLLRDIAWAHPVYSRLRRAERIALGVRGALASVRWRHLVWHLVTPTFAGLASRRRGRRLWSAYLWLTRAAGAARRP